MTVNFSPPKGDEVPVALRNPEPTAEKRVRRYNAGRKSRVSVPKTAQVKAPALDVAALAAKYGGDPQNTTQTRIGTFKVPIGISIARWERIRNLAAEKFVTALKQQGWIISRIECRTGVYPYRDILTGTDDPGFREMQIVATGGIPKVERTVIELDKDDVEALVLTR